jgi:diguanylate cyclase (GGDEF)-like protein
LAQIAKTMQSRLRAGDFIARYGGEEFLIVLPDVSAKDAGAVANRLRDAVARNAIALEDHTHVRATVSIGVAVAAKSDQKTMHALRHAADRALYDAKRNGRNRIELAGACTPHGRAICRAETGS